MDGTAEIDRRMLIALLVGIIVAALVLGVISRDDGDESAGATTTEAPASGAAATPAASEAGVDHHHANADQQAESLPNEPLDDATRDQVAAQLVAGREVALRFPTVADAEAAGFVLAGGFAPLVGAHYVGIGNAARGTFDPAKPPTLIYDGTSPTSRITGLMYLGGTGSSEAPEGFAGPNDHWHRHTGVCVKFTGGKIEIPFAADRDITKKMCDGKEGTFMDRTQWMVHAWVVPGWDSPDGVFSHDHADLHCADGTDDTDAAGFCEGT
jgi:hypothetical protein